MPTVKLLFGFFLLLYCFTARSEKLTPLVRFQIETIEYKDPQDAVSDAHHRFRTKSFLFASVERRGAAGVSRGKENMCRHTRLNLHPFELSKSNTTIRTILYHPFCKNECWFFNTEATFHFNQALSLILSKKIFHKLFQHDTLLLSN